MWPWCHLSPLAIFHSFFQPHCRSPMAHSCLGICLRLSLSWNILFLQLPNTLGIHYQTFEFPLKHHILSSRPLDNLGSVILCSLVTLPLSKQLACSLQLHALGTSLLNQGSANYDPEAKFGPAPVFVNKVSLKHRKAH